MVRQILEESVAWGSCSRSGLLTGDCPMPAAYIFAVDESDEVFGACEQHVGEVYEDGGVTWIRTYVPGEEETGRG